MNTALSHQRHRKTKAHVIPRRGEMQAAVTKTELDYFSGGRLGLFRIWRRGLLAKIGQSFGTEVRFISMEVKRDPNIFASPVWYIRVIAEEVIKP